VADYAPAVDDLGDAVERFVTGSLSAAEFTDRFRQSRVYALRRESPGFVAVGPPGAGYIPIFSSLTELARYGATFPSRYAEGVDWLSTTGEDLLTLLPEGYGLVVNVASEHAVRLDATAIDRQPVLTVHRRDRSDGV
jgi:SseB protein N-terminal domain